MATPRSEFTVAGQRRSDLRGPVRWILSHPLRHRRYATGFLLGSLIMVVLNSAIPGLTGSAFDAVVTGGEEGRHKLARIVVLLVGVVLLRGVFDLAARLSRRGARQAHRARRAATSSTPACSARARPSTTASGSATSWRAPPTTSASSAT